MWDMRALIALECKSLRRKSILSYSGGWESPTRKIKGNVALSGMLIGFRAPAPPGYIYIYVPARQLVR